MSTEIIIGSVLASSVLTVLITKFYERKQSKAGTIKLQSEAGNIVLEGELKVTEFYKKQLDAILEKYNDLEARLNDKVKEHLACETRIDELQAQYIELQRQFTLLKTQLTNPQ